MKEDLYVDGRYVGYIDRNCYVKRVSSANLFYKFNSWSFTESVLNRAKLMGVEWVVLDYVDERKKIRKVFRCPLDDILFFGCKYMSEGESRVRYSADQFDEVKL